MKKSNQKFQELVKKMETLKETEKGQLRGGFLQIKSFSRELELDSNSGICISNDCKGMDNRGICIGQG